MIGEAETAGRREVLAISAVAFMLMLGFTTITPSLPLYVRSFGVSEASVGLLISGVGLARILIDIPGGFLAGRGPKRTLILGAILLSSAALTAGLSPSYSILFLARLLEGVGIALFVISSLTILSLITTGGSRGKFMSLYTAIILVGSMLGPAIGGAAADAWGLNAPYLLYSLFVAIAAIIALLLIPSSQTKASNAAQRFSFKEVRLLLSNRSLILVELATFSLFFTRAGITSTLIPIFATDNLSLPQTSIGVILTSTAFFTFLTMTPAGVVSDRVGRKPLMLLSLISTASAVALIPHVDSVILFWAAMAFYGASLGFSGPMAAWIADLTPRSLTGTSMGLYRLFNDIGLFTGPLLLGYLADISKVDGLQPLPFQTTAVILLIFASTVFWARDPARAYRLLREVRAG